MIHFFRRIRKKLADDNKPLKYMRYAIGEIVLVVIGILIALSINNWNEERKQNIAEKEFINGIKIDLAQDKDYIKSIIKLSDNRKEAYLFLNQELVNLYDTNRYHLDSLLSEYFIPQGTFYPISGTFQAAISGNEITKFKNKSFSNSVTKLYNTTYTRLMDNAEETDERWMYLTKKYVQIRRTGHLQDMTTSELNQFHNDIFYHVLMVNNYNLNLRNAVAEIDNILLEY